MSNTWSPEVLESRTSGIVCLQSPSCRVPRRRRLKDAMDSRDEKEFGLDRSEEEKPLSSRPRSAHLGCNIFLKRQWESNLTTRIPCARQYRFILAALGENLFSYWAHACFIFNYMLLTCSFHALCSNVGLTLETSAFQNSLRRLIYPYQLHVDSYKLRVHSFGAILIPV